MALARVGRRLGQSAAFVGASPCRSVTAAPAVAARGVAAVQMRFYAQIAHNTYCVVPQYDLCGLCLCGNHEPVSLLPSLP